jgi:hypothetical protein|nr:MAG TPA: hypothetical protein [Bacteriophage sp.]
MKKLRWVLAIAFLIAGVAGGLYFGGYDLLFKPIFTACIALGMQDNLQQRLFGQQS